GRRPAAACRPGSWCRAAGRSSESGRVAIDVFTSSVIVLSPDLHGWIPTVLSRSRGPPLPAARGRPAGRSGQLPDSPGTGRDGECGGGRPGPASLGGRLSSPPRGEVVRAGDAVPAG